MCRCKYPKFISKNEISITEDKEYNRCYKVTFPLSKEGSNILVISRAPKVIEDSSCDSIYKRIIRLLDVNRCLFKGIKSITVVNLFTVYEVNKDYLHEVYVSKGKDYIEGNEEENYNDLVIAREIHNADFIIPAWGEPIEDMEEIYSDRVEFILRTIRDEIMDSLEKKSILIVGDLSKRGYPKHCLAWYYDDVVQNFFE